MTARIGCTTIAVLVSMFSIPRKAWSNNLGDSLHDHPVFFWGLTIMIGLLLILVAIGTLARYLVAKKTIELDEKNRALRESEEKFRVLLDNTPDMIVRFDRKFRHCYVNHAVEVETGNPPEFFLGRSHREIGGLPPEEIDRAEALISEIFSGGQPLSFEIFIPRSTGYRHYLSRGVPELNEKGEVVSALFIHHNITERRRIENDLKRRNDELAAYNAIISAVGQSLDLKEVLTMALASTLVALAADAGIIYVFESESERFMPVAYFGFSDAVVCELTGFKYGEGLSGTAAATGEPICIADITNDQRNISSAAVNEGWRALVCMPLKEKQKLFGVMTLVSRSAGTFSNEHLDTLKNIGTQIGFAIENALSYEAAQRELAYRQLMEKALRASEDRYRFLLESVTDYIFSVSIENGRPTATSHGPGCIMVTGYTSEEYSADASLWYRMVHPEDRQAVLEQAGMVLSGKQVEPIEHRIIHKNGSIRWVRNTPVLRFNQQGSLIAYDGLIADITDRKAAERSLRESEERFRGLFETMTEGAALHAVIYDDAGNPTDYRIEEINQAYTRTTGITREQAVGKYATELYGTRPAPYFTVYLDAALRGIPARFEAFFEPMKKYFSVSVFSPGHGRFATVFEDITERRRAEETIQASLREKEALLEEIHHRVKNNLQIIMSLLTLQSRSVGEQALNGYFQEAISRIRSMALIHEMMYQSKNLSQIDFAHYIQTIVQELIKSTARSNLQVAMKLDADHVEMRINQAVPCGLILNEIITNSLKYAFPAGWQGDAAISISLRHGTERGVVLCIGDNGIGLPKNIDFEGTQTLGLTLIKILTRQLNGDVRIERDAGTRYVITFAID